MPTRSLPGPDGCSRRVRTRQRAAGPQSCVFQAWRNLSLRCGLQTIKTWGALPPPVGRPRAPVEGRDGRNNRALLIVRDEFRPAIPRSGCSPAEPVSASPAARA